MDYNILRGSEYIGLENYVDILSDRRIRTVYGNTVVFTLFAVFFNAGVGLLLAVALNRRMSLFYYVTCIALSSSFPCWLRIPTSPSSGASSTRRTPAYINYYLGQMGIKRPFPG